MDPFVISFVWLATVCSSPFSIKFSGSSVLAFHSRPLGKTRNDDVEKGEVPDLDIERFLDIYG